MAIGLKPHTREERAKIVDALTPLIQKHVGANLLALAVSGSFARGNDGAYSDIEFFGFVKRPLSDDRVAVQFIHDGMLVDAWFITRDDYIHIFKDKVRLGNHPWPMVALNALAPVLNAPFIEDLVRLPATIQPGEFRNTLTKFWPQVQEATGKLLTAVSQGNELSLQYLYWQMVEKMCYALSLLNERPYTTRAAIFSEALALPVLPPSFPALMLKPDEPRDPLNLAEKTTAAFEELEDMLRERGYALYADSLGAFVSPYSHRKALARRTKLDRVGRKLVAMCKLVGLG